MTKSSGHIQAICFILLIYYFMVSLWFHGNTKHIKMSLKNKMFLAHLSNKTHVFLFIPFILPPHLSTLLSTPFTTKKTQKADQTTVFPLANTTSLIKTNLAATFLKLLLQHLWAGFFSQLISVWCLSWSVSSCVNKHNLWTLKADFFF